MCSYAGAGPQFLYDELTGAGLDPALLAERYDIHPPGDESEGVRMTDAAVAFPVVAPAGFYLDPGAGLEVLRLDGGCLPRDRCGPGAG